MAGGEVRRRRREVGGGVDRREVKGTPRTDMLPSAKAKLSPRALPASRGKRERRKRWRRAGEEEENQLAKVVCLLSAYHLPLHSLPCERERERGTERSR